MDRTTTVRSLGYVAFLALVWVVAAWIRPTSTYHLAPILTGGAAPVVAVMSSTVGERRDIAALGIMGIALTAIIAVGLAAVSLLEGPSLLPTGGALTESLVFGVVGGAAGVAYGVGRTHAGAVDRG